MYIKWRLDFHSPTDCGSARQSICVIRTFHTYLDDCDVIIMSDTDEPPAFGSTGKYTGNKTNETFRNLKNIIFYVRIS